MISLLLLILSSLSLSHSAPSDPRMALSPGELEEVAKAFPHTDPFTVHEILVDLRSRWNAQLVADQNETAVEEEERLAVEQQYPTKLSQESVSGGDSLTDVNEREFLSQFLYQGDIVLTAAQADTLWDNSTDSDFSNETILGEGARSRRQAFRDRSYPNDLWGSTVYYYFDVTATPQIRSVFSRAVQIWQANTCINIQESATAPNRIRVIKGTGCYSMIGKMGGTQDLSLGTGCESVGIACHELGHALGFFHTQSRVDRDSNIIINVVNVQQRFVDQFIKQSPSTNFNYGMPYDYGSVMHYGALSASGNQLPTMIARDVGYQDTMGSDQMGFYDLSMMNEHYQCKGQCRTSDSVCNNGGFMNPRTCNSCVCPSGFGGPHCDQRPSGCGAVIPATEEWRVLTDSIGDGVETLKTEHVKCNYWLVAPAGARIAVRLRRFTGYFKDGCIFGGVEVKTHADPRRTGYRICSNANAGEALVSSSNVVPVITFSRYGTTTVALEYKLF